jgi:uncharacterized protein (TIGR02001 family)
MMTQILKKALAGVAAGMMFLGSATAGEELPFDVEVGADLFSHYVWRGMILTDDPVLQPSLTLSSCGFSANVWGSIDMTDINEDPGEDYHMQELDFTLSYDFSPVEGLDLGVGVIYYTFPGTGFDSTQEAYASVALSEVPFVTPSITAYYDFDEIEGWYVSFALDKEFELSEKLALGVGASLGFGDSDYNMGYWGVDDSGLNDLNLSASLSYQVNDAFSIGISAGYMVLVGSDVKDAVEDGGGDTSQFFMGLSAAVAF